jgi:ribosome-associated protein
MSVVGVDAGPGSGWTVVDAFDVMVHLLTRENRDRYKLEILWGDAPRLDIAKLLPATAGAGV